MTQPEPITPARLTQRYAAARSALSTADPVMAKLIEEQPGFDPRALRLYGLDHLPTESELLGMAERWRPYRSLAAAYLFETEFG